MGADLGFGIYVDFYLYGVVLIGSVCGGMMERKMEASVYSLRLKENVPNSRQSNAKEKRKTKWTLGICKLFVGSDCCGTLPF